MMIVRLVDGNWLGGLYEVGTIHQGIVLRRQLLAEIFCQIFIDNKLKSGLRHLTNQSFS